MPTTLGPHLLKRQVNHDERSRAFPAPIVPVKAVAHRHYGPVLDQGQLGSCTANAAEQVRMTAPLHRAGLKVTEGDALALYHLETELQGGPVYPPADPGGSGLMVCKAGVQLGLWRSYTHAFGIEHARAAIGASSYLVGSNWYGGMFTPSASGVVSIAGTVEGGHEYVCTGYQPKSGLWRFLNSWGADWGLSGVFYMTDATFTRLLAEQGDVTVPAL